MQKEILIRLARAYVPGALVLSLQEQGVRFEELAHATRAQLTYLGFTPVQVDNWLAVEQETLDEDLAWCNQENNHLLAITDPLYPAMLKQIYDPPAVLFVVGDPALLSQPQLAIVGSRNPSGTGRDTAFSFAKSLAQAGLVITSGMALGIDAQAHRGALATAGQTVAICGTGLDRVYPAKHHDLAKDIAKYGALVSEFPLGTTPKPQNFPLRNRIISGLSVGTLVVEAALRSGSLITARCALQQGREVFAIPGSIHNPLARGCHELLKNGAKLVESGEDIVEELAPLLALSLAEPGQADAQEALLTDEQQSLLEHIGYEVTPVDIIVERSGLAADAVASMALILELEGLLHRESGGYVRAQ